MSDATLYAAWQFSGTLQKNLEGKGPMCGSSQLMMLVLPTMAAMYPKAIILRRFTFCKVIFQNLAHSGIFEWFKSKE